MGVWGTYDDENDYVADLWIDIMEKVLPSCFIEMRKCIRDEILSYNNLRREYVINNNAT